MRNIVILIVTLLLISSCDETSKPSSSYLIEKTMMSSNEEQTIESGSEFKMIFPANSITGNLEVKVKKESSAPAINIPNQKPGKNFYRIKFSGDTEFLHPVKLIINFDKSAIPNGKTAQESVFGYIYSSGTWKLADYQLDEPNGKIIISISSILGKVNKDEPILLDDGEILVGFSTLDAGNQDKFLVTLLDYDFGIDFKGMINNNYSSDALGISIDNFKDETRGKISWSGNKFTIIGNYSAKENQSDSLFITGEINPQTFSISGFRFEHYSNGSLGSSGTDAFLIVTCNNLQGELLEYTGYPKVLRYDYNNTDSKIKFKTIIKHIDYGWTNWFIDGGNKIKEEYLLTSYDKEYDGAELWFYLNQR